MDVDGMGHGTTEVVMDSVKGFERLDCPKCKSLLSCLKRGYYVWRMVCPNRLCNFWGIKRYIKVRG